MKGCIKPPLPTRTLDRSRSLRHKGTDTEQKLWYYLRGRRLGGHKFRRQHPVPPYVVDFYGEAKHLVIEIDDSQHDVDVDRTRTRYLQSQSLTILRLWDNEVLQQMDAVLEAIFNALENRTFTPTPLPAGEGLTSEER